MLTRLVAAVGFLTRIPVVREFSAAEVTASMPFFPVIGALIGLGQVLLVRVFNPYLPPLLLAVGVIAGALWLTRALHLDGLADMGAGLGGGHSREDVLRIMRDPAIGAFGTVAIVLVILGRATALGALIERRSADPFLLLAPTLGRWTMVAIGSWLPYARQGQGLGLVAGNLTRGDLALGTAMAAVVSVFAAGHRATACWLAAAAVTAVVGSISVRRLGGFTGDVLGAASELTEAAVLVVGVMVTR